MDADDTVKECVFAWEGRDCEGVVGEKGECWSSERRGGDCYGETAGGITVEKRHNEIVMILERKKMRASNSKARIKSLDWDGLPTLHRIVAGPAEDPILEIIKAEIEEGTGVDHNCVTMFSP